jgi:hypothetical protein
MQDNRVFAGLNATLDIRSVKFKILFAIFVPGPTTSGIKVIAKLDVVHQAPHYPPKLQRKYYRACGVVLL